jgi:DNA-binding PadR family transcriptional regulator
MSTRIGVFELLVLMAVATRGDAANSVAVRRAVSAARGRDVSVGAVYTTLERLERRGFVTSHRGEASDARGGRPRRFYEITKAGRQAIQVNYSAVVHLAGRVSPRLSRS